MVFYKYKFWSIIKSFLINKGHFSREGMMLLKTDNETMYINTVEKTSGEKKSHFAGDKKTSDTTQAIDAIVQLRCNCSIGFRLPETKSHQLHLLTTFMGQIQKKYLNF